MPSFPSSIHRKIKRLAVVSIKQAPIHITLYNFCKCDYEVAYLNHLTATTPVYSWKLLDLHKNLRYIIRITWSRSIFFILQAPHQLHLLILKTKEIQSLNFFVCCYHSIRALWSYLALYSYCSTNFCVWKE